MRTIAMHTTMLALLAASALAQAATPWRDGTPRTVVADLLEWNWDSVAKECRNVLGPKGYLGVKVSPPNEHITTNAWWARFQPVSYKLVSRGGDREQFRAMVQACREAGVDVYPDTIINHMANGSGHGTAGSYYSVDGYWYEGVPFGATDIRPPCPMTQNYYTCWLGRDDKGNAGLPDLDTSKPYVRERIAAYLNDLRSLGVAGFYVDAARHISIPETQAIFATVSQPYYIGQEVWHEGKFPPELAAYTQLGLVTDVNFAMQVKRAFHFSTATDNPSTLHAFLTSTNRLPADKALTYVTNHDLERMSCDKYAAGANCRSLNAYNGDLYYLANVFMLAHPYGNPYVHSSYYFSDPNMIPWEQPYGWNESTAVNCSASIVHGKWDCGHRDWRVANMAGFRNYVQGETLADWQAEGSNRIAFRRGAKGFLALNRTSTVWQKSFATGLPDGVYCNVVASAEPETGRCPVSTQIRVNQGSATLSVAPMSAVALHVGARLICDDPTDFAFTPLSNVPKGSVQSSNVVTVAGLACPAALTVSGGQYRIDGGAPSSQPTTIAAGQTLQLVVTAPNADGASATAEAKVGRDTVRFTVSTGSTLPCGGGAVCTDPPQPAAGQPVTVYYKGALSTSAAINLHWGVNGWTRVSNAAMQRGADGYWSTRLTLGGDVTELDFVFNNGAQWDNNGGQDWKYPVTPCSACAPTDMVFKVNAQTVWGESVYLSGNAAELGNDSLDPAALPKCDPANYPVWTCRVRFAAGSRTVEYRYVKLGLGTKIEAPPRRALTLPVIGSATRDDGAFRL